MPSSVRLGLSLCTLLACAAPAASAQHQSTTTIRVSAEVRPSCRIEASGSPTAAGSLTAACIGREGRMHVSVDGKTVPQPGQPAPPVTRITLEPGSVVQIEF